MAENSMRITLINKYIIRILLYVGLIMQKLKMNTFYLRKLLNKIPFVKIGNKKQYLNL